MGDGIYLLVAAAIVGGLISAWLFLTQVADVGEPGQVPGEPLCELPRARSRAPIGGGAPSR